MLRARTPRPTLDRANRIVERMFDALAPFTVPDDGPPPAWVVRMANSARARDAKEGRAGTLDERWIVDRFREQGRRCLVSGIPFSADTHFPRSLVSRPFAPSLDRIDSDRGYTPDNVRLVCTAANFSMNRWGLEVLQTLAEGVVQTVQHGQAGTGKSSG